MATVKWNQDVNAGTDWMADINILNDDGTPRDLTDHTFESLIKRHYKSVNSTVIEVTIVTASVGNIQLRLTSTQTSALKSGKYLYDLESTRTADGIKERILQGVLTIRPEITIT